MTTLYHYCNSSSLVAILSNKSIYLSSLTLSNDTMEGRILYRVARQIIDNYGYDYSTSKGICDVFEMLETDIDGLGFCMSEAGDLLSQWRGYADDGKGFSIGFSKKYLETLSRKIAKTFRLHKILYTQEEHERVIAPILRRIDEDIKSGEIKIPTQRAIYSSDAAYAEYRKEYYTVLASIFGNIIPALEKMFALKQEAFSEEKEWRLISLIMNSTRNTCLYRARGDRVIPYRAFELDNLDTEPIKKLIIGPKNISPVPMIERMVSHYGYKGITVERSTSTYR